MGQHYRRARSTIKETLHTGARIIRKARSIHTEFIQPLLQIFGSDKAKTMSDSAGRYLASAEDITSDFEQGHYKRHLHSLLQKVGPGDDGVIAATERIGARYATPGRIAKFQEIRETPVGRAAEERIRGKVMDFQQRQETGEIESDFGDFIRTMRSKD